MHFYTASIALPNGEIARHRIAADSVTEARKIARRIGDKIDATSVEVWQD
jgi:hypothetical protein